MGSLGSTVHPLLSAVAVCSVFNCSHDGTDVKNCATKNKSYGISCIGESESNGDMKDRFGGGGI